MQIRVSIWGALFWYRVSFAYNTWRETITALGGFRLMDSLDFANLQQSVAAFRLHFANPPLRLPPYPSPASFRTSPVASSTLRQLAIYIKLLCLLDDVGWYLNGFNASTVQYIFHHVTFRNILDDLRGSDASDSKVRVCHVLPNETICRGLKGLTRKGAGAAWWHDVTWRDVKQHDMTWPTEHQHGFQMFSQNAVQVLLSCQNLVALCCYIASSTSWLWFCCWVFLMDSDGGYRVIGLSRWNLWGWHTLDELLALPRNACWSD